MLSRALAIGIGVMLIVGSPKSARARDSHLEFQASFDAYTTYVRQTPRLTLSDTETAGRTVAGQFPSMGPLALAGAAVDTGWIADDRWIIPALGVGLSGAIGSWSRVLASVDGSIAELRPWTTYVVDALLPGIGVRFKERRWMFAALVRTGVSIAGTDGGIASGTEWTDIHAAGMSLLVRAQLEGCRRLDPLERICLVVAPSVYQFGFANAVTAGLRWEIGP